MPRRIAGGDERHAAVQSLGAGASTMPRRIAGGDLGAVATNQCPALASTMPRRIAGGDRRTSRHCRPRTECFNDAPANCRGRRCRSTRQGLRDCCFNDAPANCRGRHRTGHGRFGRARASTMPRRIAGGDFRASRLPDFGRGDASTMPRRIAGGDLRCARFGEFSQRASTMPRRIAGGDSMAPTHCLPMRDSTNCERCRNIAWPAARATGSGLQIVKEHDALQ